MLVVQEKEKDRIKENERKKDLARFEAPQLAN